MSSVGVFFVAVVIKVQHDEAMNLLLRTSKHFEKLWSVFKYLLKSHDSTSPGRNVGDERSVCAVQSVCRDVQQFLSLWTDVSF